MAKREDPFLLENYRFLSLQKKAFVDEFFKKLDNICFRFAVKRYVEGKTISQAAEEMEYTERAVYVYRDRIISLWYIYTEQERLEYHIQRLLFMVQKHGVMNKKRLVQYFQPKRKGITITEFNGIIELLIASGKLVSFQTIPGKKGGRIGKMYKIS